MNGRFSRLLAIAGPALILSAGAVVLGLRSVERLDRIIGASTHVGLVLFSILILAGIAAALVSYYEYHGFGRQDGVIRRGPSKPLVAITFDDGPNPKYTPKILDVLREKGVRATFFCVGLHVKKYPQVARRIVAEGHDIGNHTYGHRDLAPSTRRVVVNQIRRGADAIFSVTGVDPKLFRPPRGLYSEAVRRIVVEEFGLQMVLWTVSALDWRRLSPGQIVRRVARFVRPGAIILFHDSGALLRREGGKRTSTVEALPLVIDYLREAGYQIVPVSEMLRHLADSELEPRRILERA